MGATRKLSEIASGHYAKFLETGIVVQVGSGYNPDLPRMRSVYTSEGKQAWGDSESECVDVTCVKMVFDVPVGEMEIACESMHLLIGDGSARDESPEAEEVFTEFKKIFGTRVRRQLCGPEGKIYFT